MQINTRGRRDVLLLVQWTGRANMRTASSIFQARLYTGAAARTTVWSELWSPVPPLASDTAALCVHISISGHADLPLRGVVWGFLEMAVLPGITNKDI